MEEFIEKLKDALSEHYSSKGKIVVMEVKRNNNTKVHGLRLDRENLNMSPILYAEDFFPNYKAGVSLEEILSNIIEVFDLHQNSFDISDIVDFEKVKNNVTFRVINYERNTEYLQNKPFIRVFDLAVVFYINLIIDGASGVIAVDNNLIGFWGIDISKLFELAKINTRRIEDISLVLISDIIEASLKDNPELTLLLGLSKIKPIPMFVLTNKMGFKGAGCVLYTDVLTELAEKFESDLYVIPASIHECLLLPVLLLNEQIDLRSIIYSVNRNEIEQSDILSDNLYLFRRSSNALEIVK